MNTEQYNNLVMKTIDWFEDRHPQNVRDTSIHHLEELQPPFLNYSVNNNRYRYTTDTGENIFLNEEQSNDLRSVIETEKRNAMELMGRVSTARGKNKSKRSRTSRRSKKSRRSRTSRRSRK
jgi:hypothetical protein